jgi:choline monooxygenase
MRGTIDIDPEIRRAATLPSPLYRDADWYQRVQEHVLVRSWQLVGDADRLRTPGHVLPVTLLEGCLDEPLVLVRDERDELRCLSNVCTHRGHLVVEGEGKERFLRCRYHGRRFGLDGRFQSMPEFDGAEGFPTEADDLPHLELRRWGPLLFTSLEPEVAFEQWLAPVTERMAWLPLEELRFALERSRDYLVQASWMLYCDNYLEGYHIPFVHSSLAATLDYGSYRDELFPWGTLQLGMARDGEDAFDLPAGSPDSGQSVAAYYFWLFPNLMLNFYPWGLSVNVVRPLGPQRSRVSFLSYVWRPEKLDQGAGAALDRVEREDEEVVELVQRGVRSRLYNRGRYSPAREQGVHHFHRLLAQALNGSP